MLQGLGLRVAGLGFSYGGKEIAVGHALLKSFESNFGCRIFCRYVKVMRDNLGSHSGFTIWVPWLSF